MPLSYSYHMANEMIRKYSLQLTCAHQWINVLHSCKNEKESEANLHQRLSQLILLGTL